MVYFIVGPNGVGKTFFANKFSNDTNIKTFDTGPILRNIYKSRNLNIPFSKWIQIGETEYGDNFAIGLICEEIKKDFNSSNDIIIIGNRSIDGINYTINKLNITNYSIIYLDASFHCLKTNYESREKKLLTDKEFNKLIVGGNKMGLDKLKEYVISHPESCCYFYKEHNCDLNYIEYYEKINKRNIIIKKKSINNKESW